MTAPAPADPVPVEPGHGIGVTDPAYPYLGKPRTVTARPPLWRDLIDRARDQFERIPARWRRPVLISGGGLLVVVVLAVVLSSTLGGGTPAPAAAGQPTATTPAALAPVGDAGSDWHADYASEPWAASVTEVFTAPYDGGLDVMTNLSRSDTDTAIDICRAAVLFVRKGNVAILDIHVWTGTSLLETGPRISLAETDGSGRCVAGV